MWTRYKQHCNYQWIKGFKTLEEQYFQHMHLIDSKAEYRMKVLLFWKKHGLEATLDAYEVKERTLYDWKKKYKESWNMLSSLSDKSKTPKKKRKREWSVEVLEKIIHLREEYPNLWKEKMYPLLKVYCDIKELSCPKESTIWRLIKDMWWLRKFVRKKNPKTRRNILRKPWNLPASYPWELVSLDSVELRWYNWEKRYVVTIVDIYSRYSHAVVTSSHSSKTAMSVFKEFQDKFQFPVNNVLTDNGSEFMLHFSKHLEKENIKHYHTYPSCPKMNAHCERFNRTIREWVLNMNRYDVSDLDRLNRKVRDFLVFYNTKRVHYAFKNKLTPLQKLCLYDTIDINKITAI